MRNLSIFISLFILVTAILSGCGVSDSNDASSDNSSEKIKVTFWHHTYPPAEEFIKEKIKSYEQEHSNIEIELVSYPSGQYDSKVAAAFSQGNPPDIVNLLDYAMPAYQSQLEPVHPEAFGVETSKEVEDLFVPGALDGLKEGDDIFMIPEELNTMSLYLNAKLFEEAGLNAEDPEVWPDTWEELFDLAKQLTEYDSDGNMTKIGFNWVWGLDPFWYAQQYWPILEQYGGISEDGKSIDINSPAAVKAFTETWEALVKENIGGPKIGDSNAADGLQSFSDGKQAMAIAGPWAPPMFNDDVKENYVVAPFPQLDPDNPKTMLYTYGLSVTKQSEHPKEAWEFINYLVSDSDGFLESSGYITGYQGWDSTEAGKNLPGVEIWKEGMENGSYVWRSENWLNEGTIIKQAIENFGSGSMTVQEALDKADEQIKNLSK